MEKKKFKPPVKAAPNGMYWVNVHVNGKGKCVMAEIVDDEVGLLRLWSNSSDLKDLPDWDIPDNKPGWLTKDVLAEEVIFHSFP